MVNIFSCFDRQHIFPMKIVFCQGSASDPAGDAYGSPPNIVGWGGSYTLSIPHPLDAFGNSAQRLWHLDFVFLDQPLPTASVFQLKIYNYTPAWYFTSYCYCCIRRPQLSYNSFGKGENLHRYDGNQVIQGGNADYEMDKIAISILTTIMKLTWIPQFPCFFSTCCGM